MSSSKIKCDLIDDARIALLSSSATIVEDNSAHEVKISVRSLSNHMWRLDICDPNESNETLESFAVEHEAALIKEALELTVKQNTDLSSWDLSTPNGKTLLRVYENFTFDLIQVGSGDVLQRGFTLSHKHETHKIPVQNLCTTSKYYKEDSSYTWEEQDCFETLIEFSQDYNKCYGFGEKSGNLSKDGRKWKFWNYDHFGYSFNSDPLYQSCPFLMFCSGNIQQLNHAIFVDSTSKQEWDLTNSQNIKIAVERYGSLPIYLIVGESPLAIVQSFSDELTGRTSLPPQYALGFQQCRWSYYPESRVREISDGFIEHDIPCDVFYLDIDYMNNFECFTISKTQFPNPIGLANHLLVNNRQRFVSIIDPGISKAENNPMEYKVFKEGSEENVWCKLSGEEYVERVWPNRCEFPDYYNERVRLWWGKYYQDLMDNGIYAFWNDMNEPAVFNDGTSKTFTLAVEHELSQKSGKTIKLAHRFVHNAYGHLMARASHEGLRRLQPNIRPFLLTRSGYSGIQKYAWSWTGDNNSTFEDMKLSIAMLLNMSLVGQVMVGADVGGFVSDCNPELYARWIGMAAVCYPFFRSHSMKDTLEQNPWAFGAECEKACQFFIKLRYRLIPYMYTQIRKSTDKKQAYQPLLRPIWLDFPHEKECYDEEFENTQLLFGDSILIAPILQSQSTSRRVYLPKHVGGWFDFTSRTHYEGGQVVEFADITLNKMIILVKSGSIIPMRTESKQSVYDNFTSPIIYEVYGNESSYGTLYLDDGISYEFENGKFGLYSLSTSSATGQVNVQLEEGEGYPFQLSQEQVNDLYFQPFPGTGEAHSKKCSCM